MRVFVTGATGFVGSAVTADLLAAGHRVLGLARTDAAAAALAAAGAEAHRGDLEDLDSLARGAAGADSVIHCAFDHDFSRFAQNAEADRRAIEALGAALLGTDRPLVVTAGLPVLSGRMATEDDDVPAGAAGTPRRSEEAALALAARGVRASVVRLPQVHDRTRHGLGSYLIPVAREAGVSAYLGEGANRWSAVHRLDAAPVFRLALEAGRSGARHHAVTEEGVPLRAVAEAIGRGLGVPLRRLAPEDAAGHFGPLAFAAGMDVPASGALTRERLGWRPAEGRPGFLDDLGRSAAFTA